MKPNSRTESGADDRCSTWLDLVKTGVQIRDEMKAIIKSRPANLADNLASYIMRIRNESLRAGQNRLNTFEVKKRLNRSWQIILPMLKANTNRLTLGQILNRANKLPWPSNVPERTSPISMSLVSSKVMTQ